MSKKIRLRLHVEVDLLGTRTTPSPRLKDPYKAGSPKAHILTGPQRDLWALLFPGKQAKSHLMEQITTDELLGRLRILAPADTTFKEVNNEIGCMIEIIAPRPTT